MFTFNLIHNCRFNQFFSEYTALHSMFDYNKTPLSPLVTKVLVHKKTKNRLNWEPCGTDGWYIGPALENYLCM